MATQVEIMPNSCEENIKATLNTNNPGIKLGTRNVWSMNETGKFYNTIKEMKTLNLSLLIIS